MAHPPKVAIACQGGGSHAAFAAGLLRRLLGTELRERFDLVAISGTSGGAMCAGVAWSGLVASGPDEAARRLDAFWRDVEVGGVADSIANFWAVTLARFPVTAEISPYLYNPAAEPALRKLLRRYADLESLPADPARRRRPMLLVGAVDILNGERLVFTGETLGYDELIASAALPPLFRAVSAEGRLCWDGLFAANPPVREFTDLPDLPDEIWVIQLNPQLRETEPRTIQDITDRRNELAGNLSLGQELHFITRVNRLLADFPDLARRYKPITVRVVEIGVPGLDYPSKLDRSPDLIERLMQNGEERAPWFFDARSAWPRPGAVPPPRALGKMPPPLRRAPTR
jgi:NTE family protein